MTEAEQNRYEMTEGQGRNPTQAKPKKIRKI
uniref:Uncharacterized protein n=1 Tax=Rhizophora mucronata TaxID=61149 RepID=A0A2P2NQF5_RHIMU